MGKLQHIGHHDLVVMVDPSYNDTSKFFLTGMLTKILDANNLWYEKGVIRTKFDQPVLHEDDMLSFVENLKWHYDDVLVLYGHEIIILKGRSVGASTMFCKQDLLHSVLAIHNMNLDKFVDIYQRTLKLKAFL